MIYFLLYLFIEISVSLSIASAIGAFWTFVEVIASAAIGLMLLRGDKGLMRESINALLTRQIDSEQFQKMAFFTIVGAFLLIIPGFFTDILGTLMQFGSLSTLIGSKIFKINNEKNNRRYDDDAIDVEVIDDNSFRS
jgi:UPF0716 family protein affecting phage T7 exclusion